ncbi:MAG: hypothetical protein R3B84_20190 [Zavarzinella sp.]
MSENIQEKFQQLVQKLGQLVRDEVNKVLSLPKVKDSKKSNGPAWNSAFVDVRWFADAEGWSAKLRAVLPSGNLYSLATTTEIEKIFMKLSDIRKANNIAKWYGLKVSLTYEGIVTSELNNDPNCIIDITFLQS